MNLKEALRETLTDRQLNSLVKGFDIIGDIAIIEIQKELNKKEKIIAKILLKTHPHIKTVCKKTSEREGRYRLRRIKKVFGKSTETIHKEYGCRFRLDVKKVYFSPREATERQRIAEKTKPKETVMVMFAGIGPYPIIISKKNPNVKQVYAIEMNKKACEYMKENVKLNKTYNILPICGDVKEKAKEYSGKCDRVVMPLPLDGYKYLPLAIKCLKRRGFIHFYYVSPENDLYSKPLEIIKKHVKEAQKKFRILGKRKVLPYGPRTWKVCIDLFVY